VYWPFAIRRAGIDFGRFVGVVLLLAAILSCGCLRSRWAMDDPTYAAKYPRHTHNLATIAKQATDARHLWHQSGGYLGAAASSHHVAGDIGGFTYLKDHLEGDYALTGLLGTDGEEVTAGGGLKGGLRVLMPTRLTPFVGVNAQVGYSEWDTSHNGRDDDGNGLIDEFGEDECLFHVGLQPEAGLHYWLTSRLRLSAVAGYQVVTDTHGTHFDSWSYGLQFGLLFPPRPSQRKTSFSDEEMAGFLDSMAGDSLTPQRLPPIDRSAPTISHRTTEHLARAPESEADETSPYAQIQLEQAIASPQKWPDRTSDP